MLNSFFRKIWAQSSLDTEKRSCRDLQKVSSKADRNFFSASGRNRDPGSSLELIKNSCTVVDEKCAVKTQRTGLVFLSIYHLRKNFSSLEKKKI
jgi:hypothetical protein